MEAPCKIHCPSVMTLPSLVLMVLLLVCCCSRAGGERLRTRQGPRAWPPRRLWEVECLGPSRSATLCSAWTERSESLNQKEQTELFCHHVMNPKVLARKPLSRRGRASAPLNICQLRNSKPLADVPHTATGFRPRHGHPSLLPGCLAKLRR